MKCECGNKKKRTERGKDDWYCPRCRNKRIREKRKADLDKAWERS